MACFRDPAGILNEYLAIEPPAPGFQIPFLDVNLLRTFPYADDIGSNNPDIDNHTFWFEFGCCGENFCADDFDDTFVHEPNSTEGKLLLKDVDVNFNTSIWINFMTQCEDCTHNFSITATQGYGSWYKWEETYLPGEILDPFEDYVDPKF